MDYRILDINVITCLKCLKFTELFSQTRVAVSILGGSLSMQKTSVHTYKGNDPVWKEPMRFYVAESMIQANRALIVFQIWSRRTLAGDKKMVGEVYVPIKPLLDGWTNEKRRSVTYQLVTRSGKCRGVLVFSYDFGNIIRANKKVDNEHVGTYPPWPMPLAQSAVPDAGQYLPSAPPYTELYLPSAPYADVEGC